MEPTEAINIVENILRDLIETVLATEHGDNWLKHTGLSEERLAAWNARRAEEASRREGGIVDRRLIAYAHLFELTTIVQKRWELFKDCFGDRKTFDVYVSRLEDFRNAPMHSRELLPFERTLLEGVAGELRNKVTIFRSTLQQEREYFPRIELVTDSFGNSAEGAGSGRSDTGTSLTLHPGDEVLFHCRGWDPDGKTLKWGLKNIFGQRLDEQDGTDVVLRWQVVVEHIAETSRIFISLFGDRPYHRNGIGSTDDMVMFVYRVLPH